MYAYLHLKCSRQCLQVVLKKTYGKEVAQQYAT